MWLVKNIKMSKIKKYLILSFFLLPLVSDCQIQIGVKGGYNYFFILHNQLCDHYPKIYTPVYNSFVVSLFTPIPVIKHLNLNLEIKYIDRTYSFSWHVDDYHAVYLDYTYSTGYIDLILQPQFIFGRKLKIYISTGVYLGVLVKANIDGKYERSGGYSQPIIFEGNAKSHFSSCDFGFIQNFGMRIPVIKGFSVIVDNSYSIGIINLAKKWDYSPQELTFFNFFNITLEAGVSYSFPTSKK